MVCYLVQPDGIMFYDFVILLVIELGIPFTVRTTACQLNVVAAVVILTVRRGYSDCTSASPSFDNEA